MFTFDKKASYIYLEDLFWYSINNTWSLYSLNAILKSFNISFFLNSKT